jgi:hypothetical protein
MGDICRNEEWLAAYLDKRLPARERDLFEAHLSRCPSCLAELIAAKAELDEMAAGEPEALAARDGAREPRRIRFTPVTAAVSLAAAVLFAGAVFLSIRDTVRDREVESARGNVSRVLATVDIGLMRLSGGPERPVAHFAVYRSAEERAGGAFDLTEQNLKTALLKRGNDWRLYALLGDLYMADNQIARAEVFYDEALARRPGDARLLNDRAAAEYRLGKFDVSKRDLESALESDSTLLESVYNLAVLYRELGDRANSKRFLDSYLRKDPSSPWAERAKALDGE